MSHDNHATMINAYFENKAPGVWSYPDFLEAVVRPITDHTVYNVDRNTNGIWKKRFLTVLKSVSEEYDPIRRHYAAKLLERADESDDQAANFWKRIVEKNQLSEQRRTVKRKADEIALSLTSASLNQEERNELNLYDNPPPEKKMVLESHPNTGEDDQECYGSGSAGNGKRNIDDHALPNKVHPSKNSGQIENTLSLLTWEFDSSMPNWLTKIAQRHLSLRSSPNQFEAMTNALYWRIVDVSNSAVISEFSSEEFEHINAMFASALKCGDSKEILESSAERCLRILNKLDCDQLKLVGNLVKVKGILGAVQEVQRLSKGLENKREQNWFDDEADEVPALLDNLQEDDCLDDDVGYIFELLRYACEWIKKSIPQRHDSERDVDLFVKPHIFSCLDGVADQHFGGMVT